MKCVYIYNPKSGTRRHVALEGYIVSELRKQYTEVMVRPTAQRGDAERFAREACGMYDTIIVAGGDGTVNEIINGIAEQPVRPNIGYIPTGTTNDLAHSLGIPQNIEQAVQFLLRGTPTKRDIFRVNERYGIYVCAFGLFTATSYTAKASVKKRIGKLAYYFTGVRELHDIHKIPITLRAENLTLNTEVVLGIAVNSRYVSGFRIDDAADCHDGYVHLVLFKEMRRRRISLKTLFTIAKMFVRGVTSVEHVKDCEVLRLNRFSIEIADDTPINIDGEIGLRGSFDFEVKKQHVAFLIPAKEK